MSAAEGLGEVDLRRLREVAKGATPGPWVRSGSSIETDHECSPSHDCWPVGDTYCGMKPDGSTYPRDLNRADAEHIATFDPPTVLALLDRLAAAEAKVARVEALIAEAEGLRGDYSVRSYELRAALTEEA